MFSWISESIKMSTDQLMIRSNATTTTSMKMKDNNNEEMSDEDFMKAIQGIWTTIESVDFEEFLKTVDVGVTWRVLSSGSKPSIEFCIDDVADEWTLKTHTLLNTHEMKFRLDEEFVETRLDGVRVR